MSTARARSIARAASRVARLVVRIYGHRSRSHLPKLADQDLFLDRADLFALAGRESESGHNLWLTEGTHPL